MSCECKNEKPNVKSYTAKKTNINASISNQSGNEDPFCNTCTSSSNYTYRKYRRPRPMKHYRLSYNDSINGVNYSQGNGVTSVSAFEKPGAVLRGDGSCSGCASTTTDKWIENNDCCIESDKHITRSVYTKKTTMSNQERLRQRGLTYSQNIFNINKTEDKTQYENSNNNSENCCTVSTKQFSNSLFAVQGAVDNGTRIAKLKYDTFNKTNKNTGHKFRGDYKTDIGDYKQNLQEVIDNNKNFKRNLQFTKCC